MKTEIVYATECAMTVYFDTDSDFASADWREHFRTLADAIACAENILDTQVYSTRIVIWDAHTGEVLAECSPDPVEEYDLDWDYNEDMGFDPYMGCYSDDC